MAEFSRVGRDFFSVADLTRDEIEQVFDTALQFKQGVVNIDRQLSIARGRVLALIFDKASLRTRVSFEVAMAHLGGHPIYLAAGDVKMGEREPPRDVARVLGRTVHVIAARLSSHQVLLELAEAAEIPVINAMTDREHPCQALADLLTLKEQKRPLPGLKLAYVGDGFNVCNSLLLLCTILGVNIAVATPPGYEPKSEVVEQARRLAQETRSTVEVCADPIEACAQADAVYTDVWVSAGLEAEAEQRRRDFAPYQVNAALLRAAKPDALVMHCLPAHRGEEITDEMLEGPQSVVFQQAENRLHAQKALLALVLGYTGGD